jgi:AraC-like DNA-binding protein
VFSERAEALLRSRENAKTMRGRVESALIPLLHTGDVSMHAMAAKLDVSRQTLYRALRAEGVDFERVRDDLRHEMATYYLSSEKLSIGETAYLVGFSEPSAFSRAFKRWTGHSPRRAAL